MELWHVLNRGVEKRKLFLDNGDYARFVHDLYEFNDAAPAPAFQRRSHVGPTRSYMERERELLVDLHGWCLMGNHYHLLLSERVDGGVSRFLMKLNVGYAKFFNDKYERSGTLFQGRTKKVLIERQAHFLHILHYIHFNPLDTLKGAEHWRELTIKDQKDALRHLERYRWSSYMDYCGADNFPSLIMKDLFSDAFPDYRKASAGYLRDIAKLPHPLRLE